MGGKGRFLHGFFKLLGGADGNGSLIALIGNGGNGGRVVEAEKLFELDLVEDEVNWEFDLLFWWVVWFLNFLLLGRTLSWSSESSESSNRESKNEFELDPVAEPKLEDWLLVDWLWLAASKAILWAAAKCFWANLKWCWARKRIQISR